MDSIHSLVTIALHKKAHAACDVHAVSRLPGQGTDDFSDRHHVRSSISACDMSSYPTPGGLAAAGTYLRTEGGR